MNVNSPRQQLTLVTFAIITTLFFQVCFWYQTEHIKPDLHIIPNLPSKYSVEVLSLGDKTFYFRVLALRIQNAGDTFGRLTALKDYDYEKLYQWFKLLDTLDSRSNLIPALASYYYSLTQNIEDNRYLIQYLDEHAALDPERKWWWLFQAVIIANYKLKDQQLALELANKLNKISTAPLWARQMPAFIYAKTGDACAAFRIIMPIIEEVEQKVAKIEDSEESEESLARELQFMHHFVKERLEFLNGQEFDANKCPLF